MFEVEWTGEWTSDPNQKQSGQAEQVRANSRATVFTTGTAWALVRNFMA
jgi:hypothetical protein